MKYLTPDLDFRKKILELSNGNLAYCYQCSSCTGICPLNLIGYFNPREFIHLGQIGLDFEELEHVWKCTTCAACESICPRGVKITEIMMAYRARYVEEGRNVPKTYTQTLESFFNYGNPFNLAAKERDKWAEGLNVPIAKKGTEILYYVGCTASYDPRSQNIAKSLAKIFNHLHLNYGIIGAKEKDCGNCVYFMGENELSAYERSLNEEKIRKIKPEIIVATSPHSYNFIKNNYDLPEHTEVYHYTQFLHHLIADGKLEFTKELPETMVTYHDPCYLGRHNKEYDAPRKVLQAIPGIKLVEMKHNRQLSICCGGGGGNIWMETKPEERLSLPRLNEALETKAQILATACYFCLLMFEDAVKVTNNEENIKVRDISELVAEAIN